MFTCRQGKERAATVAAAMTDDYFLSQLYRVHAGLVLIGLLAAAVALIAFGYRFENWLDRRKQRTNKKPDSESSGP